MEDKYYLYHKSFAFTNENNELITAYELLEEYK
jgi:hypothetical protein